MSEKINTKQVETPAKEEWIVELDLGEIGEISGGNKGSPVPTPPSGNPGHH